MKTCRFCLNQQEGGEYCEACGSPMEADLADFSGNSFPDPTIAAGATSLPDPTIQVPSNPTTSATPNPATSDLPDPTMPQTSVTQPTSEEVSRPQPASSNQVIYSAKQAGETVYLKNKGTYRPSGNVAWPIPGVPTQTADPNAVPLVSGVPNNLGMPMPIPTMGGATVPAGMANPPQEVLAGSNRTRTFSLTMLIITSVQIVLCCGTNILSMILSYIAYSKISKVVNHTSMNEEADKHSADVLNWVSFGLSILHLILFTIFIILLGLDVI